MTNLEYVAQDKKHASHLKLRLPSQWSTRRRLVTTIIAVFFMLTGVVTTTTYYVVNRQLETVTVNKSFTQTEEADEQHEQNSQAAPSGGDKDYVSVRHDSGKDALTLTMAQGDKKSRNLILAVSIAPIIVFGLLSGGITWIITTRTQRRINSVASQIATSDAGLERNPIVIPYENDEAYTIASAYNLMLKDLNNAISREKEFIADASHELKNPLAATSAALEIPLHNQLFDERCKPFIEKAIASNRAGTEIVNHLLELSKVQQLDRSDLNQVDVAEIIHTVLQEYSDLIKNKVQIHTNLENTYILADELLIKQMITNLIMNAIQHNHVSQPQVWINLSISKQYEGEPCIAIDISNTGTDLSNMNVNDLLSPFNRGESSRINEQTGLTSTHHGLGLSIVQEIVVIHHGHLSIQPRHGGGLKITILLPAMPQKS